MPERLTLLTLNAWGLKHVSKHRRERLSALAGRLALGEEEYSVVLLQEVWCQEDWEEISTKCSGRYPYRRWFSSGMIAGPGLAVLSKWPIKSTFLYRFPVNGRPSAFWRGDWYVGKSVAVTVLDVEGVSLAVLNSHLHAPYALSGDAKYECHRTLQAWDLSRIVRVLKDAGHAVVIVGDMNSRKGELSYDLLTGSTGLVDSWEQVNEPVNLEVMKSMSPMDQVEIGGATCDSVLNTWRAHREPWEACRLDYALVDGSRFDVLRAKVVFTEKIPGVGSYSDHFGYEVEMKFKISSLPRVTAKPISKSSVVDVDLVDEVQSYKELVALISTYTVTAKWQKQWRITHFFVSFVLVIAITVATTFTSTLAPSSSILWVLSAVIIAVTGVIDGLIGYLFGNYELRQLKEVEEEVMDLIKWLER